MSEWICKNTTLKKEPFSFQDYEFQKQIVDDMHPNLNVIKISQVGLTEVQIRKALGFLVRNRGTSLIFSLPTEDMFERVSKGRVKPIVNSDKVFNSSEDILNKSVRSIEMMQFGQSFLYLVPATESAATSINADFVMNDEVDLSDSKMISLFNSRLQGSNFRISQKFSTPTYFNHGIDLHWQTSDQHLYMCKCDSCGHYNHPEFNSRFINLPGMPEVENLVDITVDYQDRLDLDAAFVMCEKCGSRLPLGNPERRLWVPMHPNRTTSRGYKVSPFVNDRLDVKYIFSQMWNYQKNEFTRGFYNTVLGLPYSDSNSQIPEDAINRCFTPQVTIPDLSQVQNLWVGVDVGQTCHVTLGAGSHKDNIDIIGFYTVQVENLVEHLVMLKEKYNLRGGCIDRHPYEPTAREIFRRTNGVVIPVEYRGLKDFNIVEDEFNNLSHIQVNRTAFLDNVATRIRKGSTSISGYGTGKTVLISHLRDMVREETPEKQPTWIKLSGQDHYFHSTAFMFAAANIRELVGSRYNTDQRSFALASVISFGDNTHNLAGFSQKRQQTLGIY